MKRAWMEIGRCRQTLCRFSIIPVLSLIFLSTLGCSDNNRDAERPTASDRQEQALRDPFGYSPGMEKTDISGGDLGTLNKDAMRKDMDSVFNP